MAAVWERSGNPSSVHGSGRAMRALLEDARERLASAISAAPAEIVFTSGGTEADNLAVRGAAAVGREQGRPEVAAGSTEHVAVLEAVTSLGDRARLLPVDPAGVVEEADLVALTEQVSLLSIGWVNSETGTIQDPHRTVAAASRAGALAHSDAVQALGHVPVDFAASQLDAMSLSAHKVGGPVGIGALVARREARLLPQSYGGGQERRLRSGTVPVALAAGFAAAATEAVQELAAERDRLQLLGERLHQALLSLPAVRIHQAPAISPAIVHATFADCRADDLLLLLDAARIDCSTGSACSAGVHQPSHVLLAMGRSEADAVGSLRFSFGPTTTAADIDVLATALAEVVPQARRAASG